MVAITKFTREHIFDAVKMLYSNLARNPDGEFHFPKGRFACEFLGYPEEQLNAIPETAYESFAGVGYPFNANIIQSGQTILDIGAGAGTDVLISALLCGDQGKVYGLDMTQAMQDKLAMNVEKMSLNYVEPVLGNAEQIPLDDSSIDIATSNGVLNLVPDKQRAFNEMYRVLKPGGQFQISDIIITKPSHELDESKSNPQLWAECIVGAVHEKQYIEALASSGFKQVEVLCHQDYFAHATESTYNVARYFNAESITITGKKI